mgnify:CR=1 FL=1
MAKRVTLGDIAKELGVSTATVSLALNAAPGSRIPPETADKVRRVARKMGYRPNNAARALKTGKTGTIGFISDEVTITRFASPMITGLLDRANELNHAVVMTETGHHDERYVSAVETLLDRGVDALVIGLMAARDISLPSVEKPVVICNGTSADHPSVLPDDFTAGSDAVRLLVDHGHQQIGLIGRYPAEEHAHASHNVAERFAGIDAAMAAEGLQFTGEFQGTEWEPDLGYKGAIALVNGECPTAILAANDRIGFGVYQALNDKGLNIPGDVSVLSFDDEDLASLVRPGLTTFRLPYREMGAMAAEVAVSTIENPTADTQAADLLSLKLIERDSIRAI